MNIKGYELNNQDKVIRAAEGNVTANGEMIGGVGYKDKELLLATYDKLGGLITKNGVKVKTGSFFDFKLGTPLDEPEVVFLVKVGEDWVEVPEGEKMPIEVEAQKILDDKKKEKAAKGKKKVVKADNEVEE